ncbi:MAG: ABC transporter substrate-binding protein [Candidatus Parvarchaeota archaeon]|nr:ABC transporter substrate-binding protein [Candidatus Bathyarchaeota archaeon]
MKIRTIFSVILIAVLTISFIVALVHFKQKSPEQSSTNGGIEGAETAPKSTPTSTLERQNETSLTGEPPAAGNESSIIAPSYMGFFAPQLFSQIPIEVKYSKRFSMEIYDDSILLTDGQGRKIALVRSMSNVPSGKFDAIIEVPVKRVVHLNEVAWYLWTLNRTDVLVGVSSTNWYIDEINRGLADGRIIDVGSARSPDYEKIMNLKPDVVFLSVEFTGPTVAEKLESLGIKYVSIDAYKEQDPLARVEWIKFVGAFVDKLYEATKYFNSVEGEVLRITQLTKVDSIKPRVAYALLYSRGISIPGGESYHRMLVEIVNGKYIFDYLPGSGYVSLNKEEFLAKVAEADVYIAIYMGTPIDRVADLSQYVPEIVNCKPFLAGRVYAMQPWFWQYICKIDVIAKDLAAILYPEMFPNHQLTMFKRIS